MKAGVRFESAGIASEDGLAVGMLAVLGRLGDDELLVDLSLERVVALTSWFSIVSSSTSSTVAMVA